MAPKLASKRRRKAYTATTSGGTQMDRLSCLPDSVLCHIMSFLPTITSVTTMSRLSSRWRHLWKDLQVFRFSSSRSDQESFNKFAFYVNAVLALRRSRHIQKFHFIYEFDEHDKKFQVECIEMWVRAAIGPRLEELDLDIYEADINLPPSFFMSCNNLVSLSLCGKYNMEVKHSLVQFPSLKKVYLSCKMDSDSIVAFLSGCPKLEDLESLYGYSLAKAFSTSKKLKSSNDNFTWTYLHLGGYRLGIAGNFPTMAEAFLDVFSYCQSEFVDPILNDLQNDDFEFRLLARHSTSKWPLQVPVINYPEFRNLEHLKFTLPCFNSNILVNVLEKCHMLQVLIINSHKEEPSALRTWEPQSTTVPRCLISHLKYICIVGYQGFEDGLTFAEFILRNGLVLETMLIFVDISMDITNKYRSIKRLTNIPRGSVTCQLNFDADGSP